MSQQCTNCAAKDAIIARQQAELNRLRRIIQQARNACAAVCSEVDKVLSTHQPRGKWAFAKGAQRAAQIIAGYLTG